MLLETKWNCFLVPVCIGEADFLTYRFVRGASTRCSSIEVCGGGEMGTMTNGQLCVLDDCLLTFFFFFSLSLFIKKKKDLGGCCLHAVYSARYAAGSFRRRSASYWVLAKGSISGRGG